MPRDIDDAGLAAAGEFDPGKAQVDGHLALFFFRQPVRVNTCEGENQRRFAVVDMSCGTKNIHLRLHHFMCHLEGVAGSRTHHGSCPEPAHGFADRGEHRFHHPHLPQSKIKSTIVTIY